MKPALLFLTLWGSTTLHAHVTQEVLYAFEKTCMVCHNAYKENEKAPPLVAVNQVYLRLSDGNMSIAREKMEHFLASPDIKYVLMKPAEKRFGIMPKLTLTKEEISDYAQALIETEFEIPQWFEKHYRSHQLK